jgi:Ca-activated chloride channel family protein
VTTGLLLALLTQGFGIGDVERGNRHYRAGRYAEAAAAYQEALRDGSDSPQLRYNLGTALLQLGRLEEAEQQLRAALAAVDPELRERAHYNLGNRFLAEARRSPGAAQAEQLAAAIESYQQALRIAPGDTHAKWNLELALREQAEQQRRRQQQAEQEEQDQAEEQQQSSAGGSGSEQSSAADAGAERGDTREQQSLEQRQADQILNAAEQDERELARERLRKGQRRTPVLRDW